MLRIPPFALLSGHNLFLLLLNILPGHQALLYTPPPPGSSFLDEGPPLPQDHKFPPAQATCGLLSWVSLYPVLGVTESVRQGQEKRGGVGGE